MNRTMLPRLGAAALLATALAACTTVGPDYQLPARAAVNRPEANAAFLDTGNDRVVAGTALPERWWSLYRDPTLDALIEQALRDNVDLKVADATLRRSAAAYDQALAAGGFDVGGSASVARGRRSAESFLREEQLPVMDLADADVEVSYQFDLFGRIRRGIEAAHADHEAMEAASDLARISVVSQVAGSYVEICHANHALAVANHSLQLQQRSRDISARLVEAGRGTPPDLARAQAQVAMLQATLPPLHARRDAAGYRLAALLGRTPGQLPAGVADCAQAPELDQPIPVGDGRTLLARRPDVRAAERRLAAATADIGIATAEMYPDISLGGSLGVLGQLAHFGKPSTQQWSIGPLISWSLPTRGAHARVRAAQAGADVALAQFDRTVLDALRETQTALSRYAHDLQQTEALREAQRQADLAADQNRRLYQAGRTPYLTSLDAERGLASADIALANAEAAVAQDQIHLFLALGGGWEAPAVPVASAPAAAR